MLSTEWAPWLEPPAECPTVRKHLLRSINTSGTPTCQAGWQAHKSASVQGDNFLSDLGMQRTEDLCPSMPTFLPALFGLYLPQLSQACGMAPQQTHFTDGIAEAQRGEGLPLSHTACKQKGWGLSHPPQSLFTWSLCQFCRNTSSCGQEGLSSLSSPSKDLLDASVGMGPLLRGRCGDPGQSETPLESMAAILD